MGFHLDENAALAVAIGLRRNGIDVTTATDAGLLSADDDEHVEFAQREDRVTFTHDTDFLRIASRGTSHAGIIFAAAEKYSVGDLIRLLLLVNESYEHDELRKRIEYL